MGLNLQIKILGVALATSTMLTTSAIAGGFDRGGVNIDLLFDTNRFASEAAVTFVAPQRSVRNVRRAINEATLVGAPPALFTPAETGRIEQDSDYVVPRFGVKGNVAPGLDCLATYSEPFGADQNNGINNALSATSVEFEIDTQDYGLTCSYQFGMGATSVGDSFLRIIGGGSYQELQGFQSRQRFLDFVPLGGAGGVSIPDGIGTFDVEGDSFGWRAGVAYEIPDIALRAMLLYNSKYDYDLDGVQNNTGFGPLIPGTGIVPISLTTEIPQSIELRAQTGVREGTLVFANAKWQDWSQLDIIPIQGGLSPLSGNPTPLAFEPGYRDGYTVQLGVGQVITEQISALAAIQWDRGTSTGSGTQTDSWLFTAGLNYKENEQVDIRFGGAIGVLEGGSSSPLPNSEDPASQVFYDFDPDIVYALNASIKYKF